VYLSLIGRISIFLADGTLIATLRIPGSTVVALHNAFNRGWARQEKS